MPQTHGSIVGGVSVTITPMINWSYSGAR